MLIKTPSKRLSQRAGNTSNTFFFLSNIILPLVGNKKREILAPVHLDVVVFTPKIVLRRNSRALGICDRDFFSSQTRQIDGNAGKNMGSGRSFCSSLYAIIVCGILE